jgi:hypothetical protein
VHPDLMHALAIERQHSLLEDARRTAVDRSGDRAMRRSRAHRRSPMLTRLSVALRHPTL